MAAVDHDFRSPVWRRDGARLAYFRVSATGALELESCGLAGKTTTIAKMAAKLAVGFTLDEIPNDITRETPASFEPTIDYCVVKIPRFTFEKFRGADDTLGISMKSVGEVMSIGATFKESVQKALCSLETGLTGFEKMDGDIDLIKKVTSAVNIPVIANGGAGSIDDFAKAVFDGGASAVAAGGGRVAGSGDGAGQEHAQQHGQSNHGG